MPPLLYDPPDLGEHAARVDPPMSASPGAMRTLQDVMAAGGDPRDRFRYERRYEAYLRCWNAWAGAPASRSFQGLIMMITAAAAVAPLKPRILYKRESELDRQTIPLQGVGWAM